MEAQVADKPRSVCWKRPSRLTSSNYVEKEGRFNDLLTDRSLYRLFEAYLQTDYCQENLWFYRDVSQFKAVADPEEMKQKAEQIIDNYFGGSDTHDQDRIAIIYIPDHMLKKIMDQKSNPNPDMFERARRDVESLLQTKYVYFCQTST